LSVLLRSATAVWISDGLFASATGILIKPYATPFRVFRGVASVVFGKSALDGGTPLALVGIGMHFITAFFWSSVLFLILKSARYMREAIRTWPGVLAVAAIYGPAIWLFMSLVFIPSMVHRPPTIGLKWWVQLIGHMPFVAVPMILAQRSYFAAARSAE
jgi:hypothetical protein